MRAVFDKNHTPFNEEELEQLAAAKDEEEFVKIYKQLMKIPETEKI